MKGIRRLWQTERRSKGSINWKGKVESQDRKRNRNFREGVNNGNLPNQCRETLNTFKLRET